jgi:hypothetical protein
MILPDIGDQTVIDFIEFYTDSKVIKVKRHEEIVLNHFCKNELKGPFLSKDKNMASCKCLSWFYATDESTKSVCYTIFQNQNTSIACTEVNIETETYVRYPYVNKENATIWELYLALGWLKGENELPQVRKTLWNLI